MQSLHSAGHAGLRTVCIRLDKPLFPWDGFGFNYVEASQTRDYRVHPQDYGGFSILPEQAREEIVQLVFGDDGLRPGLLKMFLDCWHQPAAAPGGASADLRVNPALYDHDTTTRWMRFFATRGAALARRRGQDVAIITTLYGPPPWMTRQRIVRGRDLDPAFRLEIAKYHVAWVKHLAKKEGLTVRAVSLHNEGEDWMRWPVDGAGPGDEGHDYNLYWPPAQVADQVSLMRSVLDANQLADVLVSPGETTNWRRFHTWGYSLALLEDPQALRSLGLITSHGFFAPGMQRWSSDHRSAGIDALRNARPDLHAWTTSTGWGREYLSLLWEIEQSIYSAKLNGFIPWAGIQRHRLWIGGDPNPNTAIVVNEDGTFTVQKEYHVYKHACRAGQPGMQVAEYTSNDSQIVVLAFAGGTSPHPDAFVLANAGSSARSVMVTVRGGRPGDFRLVQSTENAFWRNAGTFPGDGVVDLPAKSVTSFTRET